MNVRLLNADLEILRVQGTRVRHGRSPAWTAVDWTKPNANGTVFIFLRKAALAPTCSAERTDIRIEAPPNLYEPAGNGLHIFYRNVWISPGIRLYDRRKRCWVEMPRLSDADSTGFAYFCIHPGAVHRGKNVLEMLRSMDLFMLNPGFKAAAFEHA